jgi:hypothetical protein
MSNQTEYARLVRQHVEDGRGLNDLDQGEKRILLSHYIETFEPHYANDLLGCFNERRAVAFIKAMAHHFRSTSDFPVRGAAMICEDMWLEEYAEVIKSDFDKALEQMREDLAEDRADRTSQAEWVN